MRNYFAGDPYWTKALFTSKCPGCGDPIKKGDKIFYYPKGKSAYCKHCGEWESERFNEAAEQEYLVTGPESYEPDYGGEY